MAKKKLENIEVNKEEIENNEVDQIDEKIIKDDIETGIFEEEIETPQIENDEKYYEGEEVESKNVNLIRQHEEDIYTLRMNVEKIKRVIESSLKNGGIESSGIKNGGIKNGGIKNGGIKNGISNLNEIIRRDLAETIKAASIAYEAMVDKEVKSAAQGLAHVSILKLHEEINKI